MVQNVINSVLPVFMSSDCHEEAKFCRAYKFVDLNTLVPADKMINQTLIIIQ